MYLQTTSHDIFPEDPQHGKAEETEFIYDRSEIDRLLSYSMTDDEIPEKLIGEDQYSESPILIPISDFYDNDEISELRGWLVKNTTLHGKTPSAEECYQKITGNDPFAIKSSIEEKKENTEEKGITPCM